MFKKLFIFVLSIFYIFILFCKQVYAFEFVKSQNNPLPITYINNYINQQQAYIFFEDDIYKAIITIHRPPDTYHSLGYFESSDGVNWIMKKEILNTGSDLSSPSILKTPSGYILFMTKYDNSVYKIYSSTCDFQFNCSQNFVPVILPNIGSNSEKNGVFAGHHFQQNDRTYLFFGAWGTDGFKLKLAYSDDLSSWQRCPNQFLYGGDGPFPYQSGNDLFLFFHMSNSTGIKYAKTSLPLSCDSVFEDQGYLLSPTKNYDQKHLIFPSVLNDNDGLKLYYSGLGSNSQWRLNLACTGQACIPPSPTPTLTPIPTLVPEKTPIIIIPGFMASWNRDAILHNQTVDYSAWKLQNFVKEYEGIINTLKNIGYQEDVDLFLFPYDWRQPIEKTASDLNNYLQEKIWNSKPNQKINIVGHSLGGLIGRIFSQKNKDKINQIISVGSPHFGAVQVYKPLESGEIDRDNTFLWLAEKIVLILNKSTIENDRTTITNRFPVAKDLFPTFNFLKDLQGNEISINGMSIKNSFLSDYNQSFSEIFPIFTAFYGEKNKNTPAGYTVEPQNIVDKLLGNYSDGKPKESYFDFGDYTILSKSASQDTDAEKFYFDHGEIITQKESIKKILELLNIQYQDEQIIEGTKTVINPSLIFLIKSPATMKVEFENNTYNEEDGIIFIPDAKSGNYNLKVQGIDQGKYDVVVGQISENNDLWESINGEITQASASSQIDDYNIPYNNQTAFLIFPPLHPSGFEGQATPTIMPTTETLVPTSTSQPTSSTSNSTTSSTIASSNNEIPMFKDSMPTVLGISSSQEELITPTIEITKQAEIKTKAKKSSNTWDYIWASLISLTLGSAGYLFKKKILKK